MSGARVFVDTNILLYAVDSKDGGKQVAAEVWLSQLWNEKRGRVSWQVLNEFYYNATRKIHVPERVAQATVLLYGEWSPVVQSLELTRRAWFWSAKAQVTYWDGLILAAAERAECEVLLSEDFPHGRKYGEVRVVNPFREEIKGRETGVR